MTICSFACQDVTIRNEYLHAFTKSLATIWIVMTPICGVGFLLVLGIRHYTLKRATRQAGAQDGAKPAKGGDAAGKPVMDAEAAAPVAPGEAQPLDVEKAVHTDANPAPANRD
jgi:hypothetical protein